MRPGEGELWRDGDRGRVDVVREVDQVVVVLGDGGALLQPALDLRVRDDLLLVDHRGDLVEPDGGSVHALNDLCKMRGLV